MENKACVRKGMSVYVFILLISAGFYGCDHKGKDDPVPVVESVEQVTVPQGVLLYHGYPSLANGANWNINNAMSTFNAFDIIVLGYKLQNPNHDEHNNTRQLISYLVKNGKKVYGYVPLGLTEPRDPDYKLAGREQIQAEINKWKALGVTGIFGDEMEKGYEVDRIRQNYLIDYTHGLGLSVIANGYFMEQILEGLDVRLGSRDYYFLESFGIKAGNYEGLSNTIDRGNKAREYKKKLGIGIITGGREAVGWLDNNVRTTDKFLHSYYATLLFNFDGFSYSDYDYSASGGNMNHIVSLPPAPSYGKEIKAGKIAVKEGSTYVTYTDEKKIILTDKSGQLE